MKPKVWIDLLNPSHPLFFKPVIDELSSEADMQVTVRERGETVKLSESFGIQGKRVGKDHEGKVRKTLSIIQRTLRLQMTVGKFDTALSFENPMSVAVARFRRERSVLMLDNDLKYKIKGNFIQRVESDLKAKASRILIPDACSDTLGKHVPDDRLITYPGYKEDIYIASFQPDPNFPEKVPFRDYYVIRPEALASFYVKGRKSLVPSLLERFSREGKNVVLLPRDRSDSGYRETAHVHIPEEPLNGLDLIHNSRGVLTGSGTMAREAALMGKPAVSFFPENRLLSVDESIIENGWMTHSRDIDEIMDSLVDKSKRSSRSSEKVQKEVFSLLRESIGVD